MAPTESTEVFEDCDTIAEVIGKVITISINAIQIITNHEPVPFDALKAKLVNEAMDKLNQLTMGLVPGSRCVCGDPNCGRAGDGA